MNQQMLALAAAAALAAGCTTDTGSSRARTAEQTPSSSSPTASSAADAQILDALVVINRGEIEAGQIARDKATRQEVKDLAEMMIGAHGGALEKVRSVMTTTGMQNAEGATSKKLRGDVETLAQRLQSASGPDFDTVYVDSQVRMHQDALRVIDDELLPNAKNAQLVALMKQLRPEIAMHLDHARKVQSMLGGTTTPNDMSSGR